MSGGGVAAGVLLTLGVGVVWLSCAGLLVLEGPFNRLHAVGLATVVGPLAVAAAVLVAGAGAQPAIKAFVAAGLLIGTGAVLTHATARAARIRERGDLSARPEEVEVGP